MRSHNINLNLTPREAQVLALMTRGLSDARIAESLCITPGSASNHVSNVLQKLGAHTRLEAVLTAIREGIIEMPPRP